MLRYRLPIAILLFIIPILLRVTATVPNAPPPIPAYRNDNIATPDFASLTLPEPPTPSSLVRTEAAMRAGKVAVIDQNHGNQFDPSELEPLTTALSTRGALVEFDTGDRPLEMRLKYASVYIIFSPAYSFSSFEILMIQRFVSNGGRLLVFADPTRGLTFYDLYGSPYYSLPDANITNPVIAPFGISFVNDYLYNVEDNEGNFRNVKFTDFVENPLTQGLQMVVFYSAHTVHAETGTQLAIGGEKILSSLTDRPGGFSPLALSADGQVLAVGDFTFLTNPFNQMADNNLLLARIADFALGGARLPSLANFPYLYQRPINLLTTGYMRLTPDLVSAMAMMQKTLNIVNIPLNLKTKASADADTLAIGVLRPTEDLLPYLKPFNITFEDYGETLVLPGFGKIGRAGTGLLLFNPGPKTNTFVLLADSIDNLPKLVQLMAGGDLSSCVVQGNVGVCAISSGSNPSPTPVSAPTSTPSG